MLSSRDVSAWKWLEYLKVFHQVIYSKVLEKVEMEVPTKDIDACHRVGKQGRVIMKFSRKKDFQQVLSVKKNIQKITATDFFLS